MLIFFMTEIFYRPANVSGVKTPPYIALLQPEFPGKMTANPKKLATVRRVFNTAHSMPYAFLYSHAAKRLPKEVASHGKIYKTAGRSGQGFYSPREPRGGIALFPILLVDRKVVQPRGKYSVVN